MAKRFTFRLERVLAYRRQCEEQAQMDLARVSARYRRQSELVTRLEQEFADARLHFAQKKDLQPNDFWLWQGYKQGMEHTLAQARLLLRKIGQEVVRCREVMVRRSRERKILETLKENQAIEYEQKQKQQEQKDLDEMVQLRLAHQLS